MITGTATALLVHADASYALLAVWLLALSSVLIKALRCSWDVLELHIPVFLLQGCVVVLGCVASDVALSAWALQCAVWNQPVSYVHVFELPQLRGQRRVDGVEPPRHRADAVVGTTSRRWRGASEI